jgi:hypothetical protein
MEIGKLFRERSYRTTFASRGVRLDGGEQFLLRPGATAPGRDILKFVISQNDLPGAE